MEHVRVVRVDCEEGKYVHLAVGDDRRILWADREGLGVPHTLAELSEVIASAGGRAEFFDPRHELDHGDGQETG